MTGSVVLLFEQVKVIVDLNSIELSGQAVEMQGQLSQVTGVLESVLWPLPATVIF